jgi:hypothetical protein
MTYGDIQNISYPDSLNADQMIVVPRSDRPGYRPRHRRVLAATAVVAVAALGLAGVAFAGSASAAAYETSVGLGTAAPYSALAGSTVTNTGTSVLNGNVGVSPGSAVTGFPPGITGGVINAANAAAAGAQSDLTIAYNDAAGRTPTGTSLGSSLVGGSYQPGVYNAASSLGVSGAVTLDGQGNPNSVFIFQVGAALTTATSTSIVLIGNAQACNVFWQVGTSATLGTSNAFVGTVMALTSVTANTGTTIQGRALARNGAVTLDTNTFTSANCASTPTTTTVTTTPATTGTDTTLTASVTAGGGAVAPTSGTVTFLSNGVPVGTAPVGAGGVATLVVPAGTAPSTSTITATYSGLVSYGPSTSTATDLVVTEAVVPAVNVPVVVVPTSDLPLLPSTGTDHVAELSGAGGALLAFGLAFMLVAARRRAQPTGRHHSDIAPS